MLVEESGLKSKTEILVEYLKKVTKEELSEMGKEGIELIRRNYSKEAVTSKYLKLAETLL
jgi:glycosyltransferase involved in cell wall biosynthesis